MANGANLEYVAKLMMSLDVDKKDIQAAEKQGAELANAVGEEFKKGFKNLGNMINESLAKAKIKPIDLDKIFNPRDVLGTLNGLGVQVQNIFEKNIGNGIKDGINTALRSNMFKGMDELNSAYNRNKNASGAKTGVNVRAGLRNTVKKAFEYEPSDKAIGIGRNLATIKGQFEKATNWEEQYAALLKYIKAYEALERTTSDPKSLDKWKMIGEYTIDNLKAARPEIEHSLQNIFNVAYGKAVTGFTSAGDIDLDVKLTPIKMIDAYDVAKGGQIEVEVVPVVKKAKENATPNMFRGVHEPEGNQGKRHTRETLGANYWADPKSEEFIARAYGDDDGADGKTIKAYARPLNTLEADAKRYVYNEKTGNNDIEYTLFNEIDKIKMLQHLFPGVEKFKNVADPDGGDRVQKFYNEMARQAGFDIFNLNEVNEGGGEIAHTKVPLQNRILEYIGNIPDYLDIDKFTPEMEREIISRQKGSAERWYDQTIGRLENEYTMAQNSKNNGLATELSETLNKVKTMRETAMKNFDQEIAKYGGYDEDAVKKGLPKVIDVNEDGDLVGKIAEDSLKDRLSRYADAVQKSDADINNKSLQREVNEIQEQILAALPKKIQENAYDVLTDFAYGDKSLDEAMEYFSPHLTYKDDMLSLQQSSLTDADQIAEATRRAADEAERKAQAEKEAADAQSRYQSDAKNQQKILTQEEASKGLVDYIGKSGKAPNQFFDDLINDSQHVDAELKNILTTLGMIDSQGTMNLKSIDNGFTNLGGAVSDVYTMISRTSDYLPKAQDLMPKLAEAKKLGANVGTIEDIIEDKANNRIYELQKTMSGEGIRISGNSDFLEATDEQVLKLISDLKILQKTGLYIDFGGDNILYDKEKGFSFIDLATRPQEGQETVEGNVNKMLGFFKSDFGDDSRFGGFANKLTNTLSSEIPQAANKAKQAVESLNNELKETDNIGTGTGDASSAELEKLRAENEQLLRDKDADQEYYFNKISDAEAEAEAAEKRAREAEEELTKMKADADGKKLVDKDAPDDNSEAKALRAQLEEERSQKAYAESMENAAYGRLYEAEQEANALKEENEQLRKQLANVDTTPKKSGKQTVDGDVNLESTQLKGVREAVEAVTEAVNKKNKAFHNEGEIVGQVVGKEVNTLSHLKTEVQGVNAELDKLFNTLKNVKANTKADIKVKVSDDNKSSSKKSQGDDTTKRSKSDMNQLEKDYRTLGALWARQDDSKDPVRVAEIRNLESEIAHRQKSLGLTKEEIASLKEKAVLAKQAEKIVIQAEKEKAAQDRQRADKRKFDNEVDALAKQYEKLGKLQTQGVGDAGKAEEARQLESIIQSEVERLELDKEHNAEILKGLQLRQQEAKASQMGILAAKQQQKYDDAEWKAQVKSARGYSGVNAANATITKGNNTVSNIIGDTSITKDMEAKARELQSAVKELSSVRDSINHAIDNGEDFNGDDLARRTAEVKKLTSEMESLLAVHQKYTGDNVESIAGNADSFEGLDMKSYEKELTRLAQASTKGRLENVKFNAETKELSATVKTGANAMTTYSFAVDKVEGKLKKLNQGTVKTETFFEGVGRKTKELAQYAIGSLSIYDVWNQVRQGFEYVKEIDSAMMELRKVTNETEQSYSNFLNTASQTGAKIGSTISDYTRATATFAKLGYDMDMASDMAKSAIVYQNVGDGIESADAAAESIISTMKGFGLEASNTMAIVDSFNEVGNRFAIGSKGIGDALQRSSSAMSLAGNSMHETIGLITAAM